jgi:hypothetical protein
MWQAMKANAGWIVVIEPTPEERAEMERARAEYRQREALRLEALAAARERLAAITDPLTRAILDLHAEGEREECQGCDVDGYEAESPPWPCRTVETVAAHHGIGLPS